tara:strand:- start:7792 stop:9411 length:1620 start_codon:yes stop_codon:yes gene_type:complete
MAYTINKTDGTILATIVDGTINTTATNLTLIGKSYSGWGENLNENLVKLLENSASTSAPTTPLRGQLWFDTNTGQLKVYNGSQFEPAGGAQPSTSVPTSPGQGDLWLDSTNDQVFVYTGDSRSHQINDKWELLGPVHTASQGESGFVIETIASSGGDKVVSSMYANSTRVAILSKETFTPSVSQTGFASIKAGLTLNSTLSAVFEGTNTSAAFVDVSGTTNSSASLVAGGNFLRADASDTTTGALTIDNDTGVIIGDSQDLTISVSSNDVTFAQTEQDKDMIFTVNDGGVTTEVMRLQGAISRLRVKDLEVTGEQVILNTTNLSIEDSILELNRNVSSASGMPDFTGIKANRGEAASGTEEDLFWVWDETFSDDGTTTFGNAGGAWTAYRSDNDLTNKDLVDIRANVVHATSTSAQYADLAEKYTTDAEYEPGTVMMFSGEPEVTICNQDMCTKVAGVISENPAYLMNASLTNSAAVVALMGRVKVKVKGTVQPGDMLVSAGDGFARAESNPTFGSVIGKALSSHSESEGTIEMVVGRC